jgi:VWFA-related protein
MTPALQAHGQGTNASEQQSRQTPKLIPRSEERRELNYLRSHRIRLEVQVASGSGIPLPGLSKSDFTVLDNGQQRSLVSVESTRPGSGDNRVILVLDEENNSAQSLHRFEKEIATYLFKESRLLPHPIALGRFSSGVLKVGQSTTDRDALLLELTANQDKSSPGCIEDERRSESLQPPWLMGGGATRGLPDSTLDCMNRRFVSSVSGLYLFAQEQAGSSGRIILVWIGPGWPQLSNHEFKADTPDLQQNFFDRLVGVSQALQEARITLDAIASAPGAEAEPWRVHESSPSEGVSDESKADAGSLGLLRLALQSGGIVLQFAKDLPEQIRKCISDADSFYSLSFDAPPAQQFGEYHTVHVLVDKPEAQVRTRTVYYAEQ